MKKHPQRIVYFVGKSMLWSVLLYMVCMLVFNWDEMSAGFKQYRNGTIAQSQQIVQPDSTPQTTYNVKHSVIATVIKISVEQIVKAVTTHSK
jgi:hypothetical protein